MGDSLTGLVVTADEKFSWVALLAICYIIYMVAYHWGRFINSM